MPSEIETGASPRVTQEFIMAAYRVHMQREFVEDVLAYYGSEVGMRLLMKTAAGRFEEFVKPRHVQETKRS